MVEQDLVAAKSLGLPSTLNETFTLLGRGGGLDPALALRMERMVGFRNIAVLEAIFVYHLGDLREFCSNALRG